MASTYITRTLGSGAATTKMTYSTWLKGLPTTLSDGTKFFACDGTGGTYFRFNTNYTLEVSGDSSPYNASMGYLVTNRVFRDNAAWIHIVIRFDSTESSANDRLRIYINGVDERGVGGYSSDTMPNTDAADNINLSGNVHRIGGTSAQYWAGLMSHTHLCIGYSYAPTEFGEVDSTSGMWKIKTSPSVSYGTNGFFLKMEDSSNMDLDSSPNAHTFATTGDLTATKDNPDNNFNTMNPLRFTNISATYSNGNNTFIRTGTGGQMNGTMGITKGKWYWECLIDDYWQYLGWTDGNAAGHTTACDTAGSHFYGVYANASTMYTYANGSSTTLTGYTVMASGQYISMAFDADNGELYYGTNGTWGNSSDPAARTNPMLTSVPVTENMTPGIGQGTGSRSSTIKLNFGNGYFGTTSSGTTEADDAGLGQFKYDVPAGFYALCTKNIKAYG